LLRLLCIFGLALFVHSCLPPRLFAQVIEIGGGTSTLYQGSGGSIATHAPGYDLTLGAGTVDGHLIEGARLVKPTPHAKYILGDDQISFQLPTDIFDAGHFLLVRGAGVAATRGKTDLLAFAGATATAYSNPLFIGAKTNELAGVFIFQTRLSSHLRLFSDTVAQKTMTEIEAIEWTPRPKLDLALSAGIGANQPYAASSLKFSRSWIDADAAYIEAGPQFQRVSLISPLQSEADRENVQVTVKPFSFLTFGGGRQNYLTPQQSSTTSLRSSIDQGSVGLRVFATQLNGTIFQSTFQSQSDDAGSLSASRDFTRRFRVTGDYLTSRPRNSAHTSSFISTLSEILTSRLSVNENVTYSGGHTGITFGGEVLSNFVTVSANYDTFFVPANNNAFEQALVLDVKMNLFGRVTLHGGTYIDPTGHLRYTADANTVMWRGQNGHPAVKAVVMEPAIMRGCVVDASGRPVEGAALLIDKRRVYTGSDGCFFLREHKPGTHPLQVVVAEFLGAGKWHVVSAPATITSKLDTDNAEPPAVVVVGR